MIVFLILNESILSLDFLDILLGFVFDYLVEGEE